MRSVTYGYTVEERNLILYSDHAKKDYPALYAHAVKYAKANPRQIDSNDPDGKTLHYLLSRNNQGLRDIIKELQNEWDLDLSDTEEKSEKNLTCGLCGQKGLRVLYALVNRHNNNKLKIGSECIKKYDMGKEGAGGKNYDEFIAERKLRKNMSKRETDANVNSKNSLVRYSFACRKWEAISFLPASEITQEIVSLTKKEIPAMLQVIRDSSQSLEPEILARCDAQVTRFENLLSMGYEEVDKPSSEWRVTNAVYSWAKSKDKKKHKDEEAIVPILERTCAITPENIALISEEGHRIECLERMAREVPSNYRIKVFSGQTDRIKIYFSANGREYPFWVPYNLLIKQVAKHGFPESGSLSSFSERDLVKCAASIDLQDGNTGSSHLWDAIREVGASVRDEDESGYHYLIAKNDNGKFLDINKIIPFLSNAILSGSQEDLLYKLKGYVNSGDWKPYKVAKSDWDAIYRQNNR